MLRRLHLTHLCLITKTPPAFEMSCMISFRRICRLETLPSQCYNPLLVVEAAKFSPHIFNFALDVTSSNTLLAVVIHSQSFTRLAWLRLSLPTFKFLPEEQEEEEAPKLAATKEKRATKATKNGAQQSKATEVNSGTTEEDKWSSSMTNTQSQEIAPTGTGTLTLLDFYQTGTRVSSPTTEETRSVRLSGKCFPCPF